jgi:di/tricarboxylate transporter
MHVSAAPVLLLILFGFIGIKHIYTAAVNPSILTVMALIALTSVLKKQIRLDLALSRLGNSPKTFLISTTTFTALLSALVNNTPVVALLVPVIKGRAKKMGWSSKNFLLPISFAAVAGGTITLIGTSTNIVLNGTKAVHSCTTLKPCTSLPITTCAIVGSQYKQRFVLIAMSTMTLEVMPDVSQVGYKASL